MFESIWIFIKMLFQWVAIPALVIFVLIKLFFLLFNKIGNSYYEIHQKKKKEKKMSSILSRGKTEDEKKFIRYFIAHNEEELKDEEYKDELKRLWKSGCESIQVPTENGRKLSMAFDESFNMTDPDRLSLLRRKPDGEILPSIRERISVFFASNGMHIRTLTLDMMKKDFKEETVFYPYDEILDVSFQRIHPMIMINGAESRVLSSTLSILQKGGKRRTWKGIELDTEPLVNMIKEELELHR